ncbi:MAG: dienelactone hydrolase family protein [Saprospiraceae bacterium]|nr:dienelactone hydrolase family protein [Saprospiraceae bacterium]
MTRILILLSLCLTTNTVLRSQQTKACCNASLSSTAEFANLGKEMSFVLIHENPGDFKLMNPKGSVISFPCPDGRNAQGYFIPAKQNSHKYIFVIHEWWGLNDYIKNEADKLFMERPDVNVLALDMYDGKVANTREEAAGLMQSLSESRAENIVQGAGLYAGKDAKIATIGWCFGGGWSLKTAIMLHENVKACIIYYGMPTKKPEEIKLLNAPVLGIFATEDGWITPKVVNEFKDAMLNEKKQVEIHFYNAPHAFANPSNPGYNSEATADAWSRSVRFLRTYLP